jgi:hypothetical protein
MEKIMAVVALATLIAPTSALAQDSTLTGSTYRRIN